MRDASPARRAGYVAVLAVLGASGLLVGCQSVPSINRRPHPGTLTATVAPDGTQSISIDAGDTYRFDPSRITVHPGTIRVTLHNTGTGAPHDWSLTGITAAFAALTAAGQSSSAMFTAPAPGQYTFVCTIHERQGQTGTLVVLPR